VSRRQIAIAAERPSGAAREISNNIGNPEGELAQTDERERLASSQDWPVIASVARAG
jgi:hypothetical protein